VEIMMRLKNLLLEAEYTHVGYGKYKEKGKEKDKMLRLLKRLTKENMFLSNQMNLQVVKMLKKIPQR
jgi:hypothetical protein